MPPSWTRRLRLWWSPSICAVVLLTLACNNDSVVAPSPSPAATPVSAPTIVAIAHPTDTPAATESPTLRLMPSRTPVPTPAATPLPDAAIVQIGTATYRTDVADTGAARAQGLSGRPTLASDEAMLFVYDDDATRAFWMPNMNFPLDMVWIKSDCTVASVTANVPNPRPEKPRNELPRYPSGEPVRFVLEINSGQAATNQITPGARVKFSGQITNQWGC